MSLLEIVLLIVSILSVSFIVGQWLFKKDREVENRRKAAIKLAAILKSVGLVQTPEFLMDYGVGDYVGCGEKIKQLVELFVSGGESAVTKEFEAVFESCLEAKLTTAAGRALIAAKLTDAAKATDASVVANAPSPATVAAK